MLLDQGRKIEAIKRYRELTGAGLKEARDVVEAIDRGQATGFPTAANVDDRFRRELIELLRKGRKIEAIKAYRARTGAGLKEAKDAVEALDPRPPGERGGGCLAGLLLLGLIAAGGAGWIALMF